MVLDYEERRLALQHATHDCRGERSPQEVIGRAEMYLAFLKPQASLMQGQQTTQRAAVKANAANPHNV